MNINELVEHGTAHEMDYWPDDNRVVEMDWDAYPHMSEQE